MTSHPAGSTRSKAFEKHDWTVNAARSEPRVRMLDFTDQFCAGGFCPAVIGNVLVYRDKNHISDTYIRTIAPVFADRLGAAMQADGLDG